MRKMKGCGKIVLKKACSVVILSFLALFLLANPAPGASEWVEYSRDEDGNVYAYKINKGKGKRIVRLWDLKTFSIEGKRKHIQEMTQNGFATTGYEKLSTVKVLVDFDCKKKMTRGISVTMFDTGNKALYSLYYDKPEWTYILEGSLWETLQKEICK